MTNSQDIGIVVIGRNEGERLVKCLRSLNLSANSIVYVDSGSIDGSVLAAEQLGISVVNLDENQPFTAARARNEGFALLMKIKPEIKFVQFIDGDCELGPGWLAAAMSFFSQREDVAVACGRRRERNPDTSIYNRLCDIEWNTPAGEAKACGGDSVVRSDAFKEVGGFRKQLIAGEEPEFCLRLRARGWKIWRLDAEMTQHDAAITSVSQLWVRSVRSGYGYAEVAALHKSSPLRIYAPEVVRTVIWGALLPIGIGLATLLLHPAAVAAAFIYPIQICRIAIGRDASKSISWAYAAFVTVAKFAEFQGLLKFYARRMRGTPSIPIEYKL